MMAQANEAVVEGAVLGAAKQIEAAIDDEITTLETLGEDELKQIRHKRLVELKRESEQYLEWIGRGHGVVAKVEERDFFEEAKKSERLVAVFGRPNASRLGKEVEEWLGVVARKHMECRFVALDAEKCPFLCGRLGIRVLPAILTALKGKTVKVLHGLSEIDSTGKLDAEKFESKLFEIGVLTHTDIADASGEEKGNVRDSSFVGKGLGSRRR
eukprot:Plantae.Rhodophyta-Hildenbrandia_rubra.ctg21908.p1 GENE.Plantae.Rhodophyta-Hildenbrandia_rubra.ctg21908~~Plantae.Rhodophyta-Hildenbrandia_rubra.ctg21908.p1  ORF type:complete len:238 (-),score=65.04 Plantae.Rhodophyta-Hildenbrandia_rubra.ctg21908:301-939(-)